MDGTSFTPLDCPESSANSLIGISGLDGRETIVSENPGVITICESLRDGSMLVRAFPATQNGMRSAALGLQEETRLGQFPDYMTPPLYIAASKKLPGRRMSDQVPLIQELQNVYETEKNKLDETAPHPTKGEKAEGKSNSG